MPSPTEKATFALLLSLGLVQGALAQSCEVVLRDTHVLEQPYQGDCVDGKAHGKGRYTVQVRDSRGQSVSVTYEGEFAGGYMQGQATRRDNRGNVFTGNYERNVATGPGAWNAVAFDEKGEYRNNVLYDGIRIMKRPDGSRLAMRISAGKQESQCHSGRDPSQEKNCSSELLDQLSAGRSSAVVANTPAAPAPANQPSAGAAQPTVSSSREAPAMNALKVIKACSYASAFDAPGLIIQTVPPDLTPSQYKEIGRAGIDQAVRMADCKRDMHVHLFLLTPAQSAKCAAVDIRIGTRDFIACVEGKNAQLFVQRTNRGELYLHSAAERQAEYDRKIEAGKAETRAAQDAQAQATRELMALNAKNLSDFLAASRSNSPGVNQDLLEAAARYSFSASCEHSPRSGFVAEIRVGDCRDPKISSPLSLEVSRADSANDIQANYVVVASLLKRPPNGGQWVQRDYCLRVVKKASGFQFKLLDSMPYQNILSCEGRRFDLHAFKWVMR